jgi:hypothetical protein
MDKPVGEIGYNVKRIDMKVLNRKEMKSITAGSMVCEIMPGSCACDLDQGGTWEEYEQCLDDRYGPEQQ